MSENQVVENYFLGQSLAARLIKFSNLSVNHTHRIGITLFTYTTLMILVSCSAAQSQ